MSAGPGGWPPTRQALAVLNHPDRRTDWVVVYSITLERPGLVADELLRDRLAAIQRALPIVGARLRGGLWQPGAPPEPIHVHGHLLHAPELVAPFALATEPPLRLLVGGGGRRLGLAFHHAALDGRGLMGVLGALLGGPLPRAAEPPPPGSSASPAGALRRLLRPADRVGPSQPAPGRDVFAARTLDIDGRGVTARIAAAAVAAVAERNAKLGAPWRRIGLSLAVGGPPGPGNTASYRRIDLGSGDAVEPAVAAALASSAEPGELVRSSPALRLLAPLADRLSDSLLISNMGRQEIPGVARLEVYPVARGRSGVAFGAGTAAGGESTLALRAARLSQADADALLDATLARLSPARRPALERAPAAGARG